MTLIERILTMLVFAIMLIIIETLVGFDRTVLIALAALLCNTTYEKHK